VVISYFLLSAEISPSLVGGKGKGKGKGECKYTRRAMKIGMGIETLKDEKEEERKKGENI
jgi:hypothetical protein